MKHGLLLLWLTGACGVAPDGVDIDSGVDSDTVEADNPTEPDDTGSDLDSDSDDVPVRDSDIAETDTGDDSATIPDPPNDSDCADTIEIGVLVWNQAGSCWDYELRPFCAQHWSAFSDTFGADCVDITMPVPMDNGECLRLQQVCVSDDIEEWRADPRVDECLAQPDCCGIDREDAPMCP